MTAFPGSCHCGALAYVYASHLAPKRWHVRRCGCFFCRGHGARYTSDAQGTLVFAHSQPEALTRYRFGFETANFLPCRACGVYLGAVSVEGNRSVGVVNLNSLTTEPPDVPLAEVASGYESESIFERQQRRETHWTPVEDEAQSTRKK